MKPGQNKGESHLRQAKAGQLLLSPGFCLMQDLFKSNA